MDQLTSRSAREPVTAPTDTKVKMRTWVVTEMIGTFTLVSVAGAAVLSRYPLPALGLALFLMMPIYAVGHFTGGHLNAAVTLAVLTRRRIGVRAAVVHWLAQIGGGLLAAVMVREIIDPKDYRSGGAHRE